ncbi:MAG TPA: hypothetical protein VHQ41_02030 [Patescibacteria group bacterium]|jgi:alpha/beta superfamily hydrolase|nr:hypothetical protein [Patescibacteria group bacterium]
MAKSLEPYSTDITRLGVADSGEEVAVSISIIAHPNFQSNTIIINYPGRGGEINGYNNKYFKIAKMLVRRNIGAVIQMSNADRFGFGYEQNIVDDLRAVLDNAICNSPKLCKSATPNIYLMGFSAGGSAVATVCSEYTAVKKILLIAPSWNAGEAAVKEGLGKFEGEVYIVIGQDDEVVGLEAAYDFQTIAKNASNFRKLMIIAQCGHQFNGRENGQILGKAPLWAFTGDPSFPNPKGGMVLYD